MLPVIAIVGRPNVGKSTLFNCLTKTRNALVADRPGLTRDRQYGYAMYHDKNFVLIDTGGIGGEESELDRQVTGQVELAIREADAILFLVDAKSGLVPMDEVIAQRLRSVSKPVFLVANKTEGLEPNIAASDFYRLGFAEITTISASQNRGIEHLLAAVIGSLPSEEVEVVPTDVGIKVAVIGKPNVGKSTLINCILGEERLTVFDEPGTTRDAIFIPFEYRHVKYTLIDTAGVRRQNRIEDVIEKFSVIKTLQAIEEAHVVLFVIDAVENITDQDLKLLGNVVNSGKALVLVINKWDAVSSDEREQVKSELERRLTFLDYASWHFVSAKHNRGVKLLFRSITKAYYSAMAQLSTPKLTRVLEKAVERHQPPLVHGRRVKPRYAHAGGKNPPIIVIHGNQVESLPSAYQRYLEGYYRKALKLVGTPIRIEFRNSDNPYTS